MAAKRAFTENEQKLLKRNPYTYQVTAQEIHFTAEFKQAFWDLYRSGTSAMLAMLCEASHNKIYAEQKKMQSYLEKRPKQAPIHKIALHNSTASVHPEVSCLSHPIRLWSAVHEVSAQAAIRSAGFLAFFASPQH